MGDGGGSVGAAASTYRWEQSDGRSWEDLEEDASGQLHDVHAAAHYKRQRLEYASRSAKRRMVRFVTLVIDLSIGLDPVHNTDLRPNPFTVRAPPPLSSRPVVRAVDPAERGALCGVVCHPTQVFRKLAEQFIIEFFEQNPVSQLGIVVTRDKQAKMVSHIGGSPKRHIAKLEKEWSHNPSGQPTLEKSLKIAQQALLGTPTYGSREVLVLYGSVHTVDPGDVHETIVELGRNGIRSRCGRGSLPVRHHLAWAAASPRASMMRCS